MSGASKRISPKINYVSVPVEKTTRRQLDYICDHYRMYDKDVILALIKREALRLSKKEEK